MLDNVLDQHPEGRVGIKIDTEGYELEVMKGLERHISRIDFVLTEASIKNRFIDSYSFADLIGHMASKDLRFYNIANPSRPQAPSFYDCIFLQKNDTLFD